MIITILLCVLFCTLFFQPDNNRYLTAKIFILVNIIHGILLHDADGLMYYGSAALSDLAIMLLISRVKPISDTSISLLKICIVSIIVNMVGWAAWFSWYSPFAYDAAFVFIYIWAIYTLMRRKDAYVGSSGYIYSDTDLFGDCGTGVGNIKQSDGRT